MSDTQQPFGFGFPGFDFLQQLTRASQGSASMPSPANWVAPTLNVEEIGKRIEELKAVQFWLEQNSRALAATVQALEVQKMTLSALKDMNVNLGDLAKGFGAAAVPGSAGWPMPAGQAPKPGAEAAAPAAQQAAAEPAKDAAADPAKEAAAASAADLSAAGQQAMQWWGALTQQFQQIAAQAMQPGVSPAAPAAKKTASAKPTPAKTASAKPAAKKTASAKTTPAKTAAKPGRAAR